jgi:hypothetical protein
MSLVSIMKLELQSSSSFAHHGVGSILPNQAVLINPSFPWTSLASSLSGSIF